jgi:hypothetical protein
MFRLSTWIGGYLAGAVSVILALYVSLLFGPVVIDETDVEAAIAVAAEPALSTFPSGTVVYIRISNPPRPLEILQHQHPQLTLKMWTERPVDHGCDAKVAGMIPMAPCGRNDFVYVNDVSFPIWRIGIVNSGTFNSGSQVFLLKWGRRWHIFVNRGFVI